ncbi:type I toxin-antitoxin system SymE family toxin [Burkholderia sp. AU30280]|uniref:type I toxin-antitoxin system SymE family toxin n=1 Tax=Burkholderia sp. AU30280 TaxID=2879628 RepID=UPI001CF1AD7D|nr:type I toxin-antitoxin system SymE family toxin [Burkholderia sp. AU30280]MCA8272682.1 type I toxin-antitoxin system SymE family toxin [Burkholderia sp. AU30280]
MLGTPKTYLKPDKFYLYMKIGGMWLISDACFVPGRKARIDIEPGRLIITQL